MRTWKWGIWAAPALALVAVSSAAAPKRPAASGLARRGEYLVTVGGCNDCHTPWKMGPGGPAPDMTRLLSGHPQDLAVEPVPALPPGPWGIAATRTMTAWSGPWGVSFSANLTPDPDTGLGRWTEKHFIEAMRTGRHMGLGRPILPPMPWRDYARMTEEDLKAIFAYLRNIPPISNRVPAPLPPEGNAGVTAPGTAAGAGKAAPPPTGK